MREIRVKTVGQDCAKFARFRKSGGELRHAMTKLNENRCQVYTENTLRSNGGG